MKNQFDVIVIGLGAMGSASLYQLSKLNPSLKLLGVDQFEPPHAKGASASGARVTRVATGEGEKYMPFVLRSNQIWKALGNETGLSLYVPKGYVIGHKDPNEGAFNIYREHSGFPVLSLSFFVRRAFSILLIY